ncbi:hypothetical protein QVH35_08160 [Candidatus Nitrosotenuis chungbukensis]|uniref:hypothetical protein n=1 Tax=Candidatus Nitrosotenuis chungbukensis TaxID=1353246 RepID=UPI0026711716|nr:hypothetical protein [Candidatus Nitrosotenuis chungbukensis]WKT57368.1 hypothetical protein QVH35_08160 [Candidatus Nitrosotenuis chungbukensis]
MVFGWNKKKTEKEESVLSSREIKLDQISAILSDLKNSRQKHLVENTAPLFSNIQDELNSILKIIDHLSHDSLKIDDIDNQAKDNRDKKQDRSNKHHIQRGQGQDASTRHT